VRGYEAYRVRCDVPGCTVNAELPGDHTQVAQAVYVAGWRQVLPANQYDASAPLDICPEHNPFHDDLAGVREAFESYHADTQDPPLELAEPGQ